jgi:putative FmdB family regulatory protein
MPIYEYQCETCGKKFELLIRGADRPVCPACAGETVRRLMSCCGFVSKGGGGETVRASAGTSSCTGCSASSCAGCGSS